MAASKARQRNLIQSLAGVVGLDGEADPFDVLKGVAETLGMTVADDGTAVLAEVGTVTHCVARLCWRRGMCCALQLCCCLRSSRKTVLPGFVLLLCLQRHRCSCATHAGGGARCRPAQTAAGRRCS